MYTEREKVKITPGFEGSHSNPRWPLNPGSGRRTVRLWTLGFGEGGSLRTLGFGGDGCLRTQWLETESTSEPSDRRRTLHLRSLGFGGEPTTFERWSSTPPNPMLKPLLPCKIENSFPGKLQLDNKVTPAINSRRLSKTMRRWQRCLQRYGLSLCARYGICGRG